MHVPSPDGLSCDELYDLRRDVEGVPYTRAAMRKAPPADTAQAAFAHIELGNDGAVQPDIVLCAGAIDLGVPAKLIATGRGASIVNPAPGGGAKWLTRADARTELGL